MAKFIQTIQNKYFSNEILKNINKTTNLLGVYGGAFGCMCHTILEYDKLNKKKFSENIHKDLMMKSYKVVEAGVYGGVVWGIVGKTFPLFLPSYSIYKGFQTNFDGKSIFNEDME